MKLPPLGLYVHLPWCERKCPYCDFNSHEATALPERAYVDCLLEDLEVDLPLAQGRGIDTVFIGGGTPSLFSGDAIDRLLTGIAARIPLARDAEITLEANPGSAEAARFRAYRRAGVNRLSIGVQSFDDGSLRQLGRVHDSAQAIAAIARAGDAGFDRVNLDLMHGLPGQTVGAALGDLETGLSRHRGHISWYQLTIEANTVFYSRPPRLPREDTLAEIQARGEELLREAGLQQYEVSAYSRPGERCRHNLNYWTFGDYLGIGAGAHGKISSAHGRIVRYQKRRLPADYLRVAPAARTAQRRHIAPAELVGEYAMNALRLNEGFTPDQFSDRTGLDAQVLEAPLADLVDRGLLRRRGGRIAATATGRRFLDNVVVRFFPD